MSSIGTQYHGSHTIMDTVVDIYLKSMRAKNREPPVIRELKSYFQGLESVLVVYHEQREKKFLVSDHFYVVFKTLVGMDAFVRGWRFRGEVHFLKAAYTLQPNPLFLSGVLYRLQEELERITCVIDPKATEEPVRFIGPAFSLMDRIGSEPSPHHTPSKEQLDFIQGGYIHQGVLVVDLEAILEGSRQELAGAMEELAGAMEERDRAMEERDRVMEEWDRAMKEKDRALEERDQAKRERDDCANERAELIAQVRSYKERLSRYNNSRTHTSK